MSTQRVHHGTSKHTNLLSTLWKMLMTPRTMELLVDPSSHCQATPIDRQPIGWSCSETHFGFLYCPNRLFGNYSLFVIRSRSLYSNVSWYWVNFRGTLFH
jgi:hypothetical protein